MDLAEHLRTVSSFPITSERQVYKQVELTTGLSYLETVIGPGGQFWQAINPEQLICMNFPRG